MLALFVLFFVLPVLWLVLAATKTDEQLVHGNPLSFGSWHALRANWDALTGYQGDAILLWLRNSAVYSFLALIITLAVAIPAGYALAMTEFRGRRALLIATLRGDAHAQRHPGRAPVPGDQRRPPDRLHVVDHPAVRVLPLRGLPDLHLLQHHPAQRPAGAPRASTAAREFGAFRRVALPLAAPVVALVGFFSFVANWTNYFLPYVLLPESNQFPIQVGLGTLLDDVPQFNPTVGTLAVQRPELALATLVAITPVLVVFLFSQRFLVAGMLAGATKN